MKASRHWSKKNNNWQIYMYLYIYICVCMYVCMYVCTCIYETNVMVPRNLNAMLFRGIAHLDVSAGQLIFRSECSCCSHYQACWERKPCQGNEGLSLQQ